jgi:signal transduction histidine kinase
MKEPRSDAIRLIRFSAFLWIGYIIVLAIINRTFQVPQPIPSLQSQQTEYIYYVFYGLIILVCLVLAYWPWIQKKLKQSFVPLVIAIIVIAPVIINQLAGRLSPLGPRFGSPEARVLVIFPFLFVALLIVAWQYKWQHVLFVILGIAALNLGANWSSAGPGTQPFQGILAVTLIQTVIYLVVGFSVSYLVSRLRAQQQSLEEANIRLSHYASTLENLATSRERNRLALELHDTLAHSLSGLSVQLETVKAYWDVDPQTARSVLEKSLAAAHSGLEETRRALKALRATPLEDLGLSLAMQGLAEDVASRANLKLDLDIADALPSLSPDVEQSIFRVAQEAMANVVKHARAQNLSVRLDQINGKVGLTVRDDGIGFDSDKSDKQAHFGLAGMEERAHLIGGELKISSKPGQGTTVQFTV